MTCPQIYLGTGRAVGPLPALYGNPAISVSGAPIPASPVSTIIPVTVNNHGTDDSPATTLELYWSDPATGFPALPTRLIGSFAFTAGIPGAITSPAIEGEATTSFGWAPDPAILGINGGHVCLLAIVYNTIAPGGVCVQQSNNSLAPATDPLSAIHNVQVIAPAAPKKRPPRRVPMWFAFAATNTLRTEDTKLNVRALDPGKDREKLEALVAQPAIHKELSCRGLKFAVPNAVHVAEGRERVLMPARTLFLPSDHRKVDSHQCIPRLSRLGALAAEVAPHYVLPGAKLLEAARGPIDLKLLPGEQRQTLVQVEPCDRDNVVYAVEVLHEGADGQPIGGLVLLFVPPHDFF